jgi:hypothetical protein
MMIGFHFSKHKTPYNLTKIPLFFLAQCYNFLWKI